jgi:EAL domain-containing protein (putative c-di-GMP-specific phosphodiesterase class I)
VNVSTRQLVDKNFADLVATTLRETGLDPRRLELEVTESSVLQERGVTLATVRLVRQLGVRVSIDDFGTGYSALSALRQMPIDGLKIDRSFVIDLISDPAVGTITAGLISIANGLGLETTAEGVENREQLEFLHSQGCDLMQGYLFGKPMPAAEFAAELRSERPIWMQKLDRARDQ